MKNKFITALLLQSIKVLTSGDLLIRIRQLVLIYWGDNIRGSHKKALVTEHLHDLTDELGDIAREMSGWLISVAIDIVHAYLFNRPDLTQ